jgi:hypothetical protein
MLPSVGRQSRPLEERSLDPRGIFLNDCMGKLSGESV